MGHCLWYSYALIMKTDLSHFTPELSIQAVEDLKRPLITLYSVFFRVSLASP